MINEKIIYCRKRHMMSQETLANKLKVSRQTISKWEAGVIYPSLDNLLDLSACFGVTVDFLLKDDDCINGYEQIVEKDELQEFIIKAKRQTYVKKMNKIASTRPCSHDYCYTEGNYKYFDSFFGSSSFSGQETVYKGDSVCWSLNYYGKVLKDQFNGDFLKEALLLVNEKEPYRGPSLYQKGDFTYTTEVIGDMNSFNGKEKIYYKDMMIYEGFYHGGRII
ncbi:MAG: DUF5680 domain-containing protein [Erysipelotrichaceae bacterium]|nr:DUF5680 domain-containing protein [Erysipelotrichaceae bacterium]MDY5253023.1 DUF5680 domain-containing protein [Erysipelotrichaceae bacterium]